MLLLGNKDVSKSCWEGNEDSTGTVESIYVCPVCYEEAEEVESITVKHFISHSCVNEIENSKCNIF